MSSEVQALMTSLAEQQAKYESEFRDKELLLHLIESLDLESVLNILGTEIDSLAIFEGHFINLIDEDHENLVCEKAHLPEGYEGMREVYNKFQFPLGMPDANIDAFKKRKTIFVNKEQAKQYPGSTAIRFERFKINEMVVIPLVSKKRAIGTLMGFVQGESIDRAKIEDLERRLVLFTDQIKNALFYSNLKQKEELLNTIADEKQKFLEFVNHVNNLTSQEMIYELMSDEFLSWFNVDFVAVYMHEDNKLVKRKFKFKPQYEKLEAELDKTHQYFELNQLDGATPTAFLQGTEYYIPDIEDIMNLPMSERDRAGLEALGGCRTFVIFPIKKNDQPIGVLWLISLEKVVTITEGDQRLLRLLCSFIGTAIANAELYTTTSIQQQKIEDLNLHLQEKVEQLRDMALRDQLTGLYNFGAFQVELGRRVNEYQREKGSRDLSLIIIDVDFFKKFNDTYGHVAGNRVLVALADRIHDLVRKMDVPCRYGGEEFVIILPKCNIEGARLFGERLRQNIIDQPLAASVVDDLVTVSAGCACYQEGESIDDFVKRADKALYQAKDNGRNQVVVAD